METNYMTRKTWEALNKKLQDSLQAIKPGGTIAQEIGKAASYGDLSENAEWEAAIQKKDMLGNEVQNLRQRLSNVTIIDDLDINTDRVSLGTKVTLYDLDTDEEVTYQILSGDDAQFYDQAISAKSPIARGLIGKEEGDEVKINVPAGVKNFEIVTIERFS
ncbi:transcription elongation factor GreA [candidate division KSB3 bacterium]|uniref:Transcription elongation factor GreA n=1 Tax=candidate division KSB3 bacterium TaxID=2044937 RepID=A0A9D5Q6J1_9BACT|nr:transcription elongation factor GreA [candidate division KSB3 bacterium]MBD3325438.1 transcription elongation factor GreA [candidate division KSB3 bacterium]